MTNFEQTLLRMRERKMDRKRKGEEGNQKRKKRERKKGNEIEEVRKKKKKTLKRRM